MQNANTEELLKQILKELKTTQKTTLTVLECAEAINVSKEKIRELISKPNSDFPFFKVGNKVLINKDLLNMWLEKISTEHRAL